MKETTRPKKGTKIAMAVVQKKASVWITKLVLLGAGQGGEGIKE